uniref:Uncharacterized protein n=1 Tax=Aegilops tauschii subsp. strangulata TaxID=200361 RepID=A0A452XPC3_AEGTS
DVVPSNGFVTPSTKSSTVIPTATRRPRAPPATGRQPTQAQPPRGANVDIACHGLLHTALLFSSHGRTPARSPSTSVAATPAADLGPATVRASLSSSPMERWWLPLHPFLRIDCYTSLFFSRQCFSSHAHVLFAEMPSYMVTLLMDQIGGSAASLKQPPIG